jgi:ferredoxin
LTMAGDHESQGGTPGPHWWVEVDAEKCSLCDVCGRRCATGAIRSEQEGETVALLFRYRLCDGCGDCLKSCPEDAMRLMETEDPPSESGEHVLAAGKMLQCSVCGAHFAPIMKLQAASRRRADKADVIHEQCPLCRRTQMVARLIEEKRKTRGRKAEYRTGRKWSWKPVVEGDPDGPPCPEVLDEPTDPAP